MDEFDQRHPDDRDSGPQKLSRAQAADSESIPPVLVPADALSSEVLDAVLESFVLREGTDYGAIEASLETKMQQVRRQLDSGKIKIVFDPNTESVTLMTDTEWKKLRGLA